MLTKLAAAAPDDPEIDRQRALLRVQAGDPDAAATLLQGLIQREPLEVRNHVLLGIVEHRRGNTAAARTHYNEALRLDPDNKDARHNLSALP